MPRLPLLLAALICVAAESPAAESGSAPSNVANAEYPRIGPDFSVTFRLRATSANRVRLEGGAGLVKDPLDLKRGDDGVWTVTTPPAVPGFHYYWFNVDGVRVNDASSYSYFGYGRECSGIEIPDPTGEFYAPKENVPHGAVRVHWYSSKITGKWRRVFVYTPPEYDKGTRARFPALYLLHGAGENERGWIDQGHADFILDNLIAARRAKPMIVVVDSGYASAANPSPTTSQGSNVFMRGIAAFPEVMLKEIIPTIDANFRTVAKREQRAMAGLSMGGMQTLNLTLTHLDQFAWIGAMSSPPRQGFDVATAYDGVFQDAAAFNRKVKLLWIGAGTAERRFHEQAVNVHEALTRAGIRNVFYSSPGTDHEWQTWRRSLHDFAPRLFQN
jgi:enterochelin esterase-like enzyme